MNLKALLLEPADEFDPIDDGDGRHSVSVAISESDDGNRIVSLEISLCLIADGEFEFAYSIANVFLDDSELPWETQDRDMAMDLIPGDARPHIMPSVVAGLRCLLDLVQPRAIYRVVKFPNLPDKAMVRYHQVSSVLEESGFEHLEEGVDPLGRINWRMVRNTGA